MSNPTILVMNAGRGETPPCPQAKFRPGNMVRTRKLKWLREAAGRTGSIAAVVPPGFPPEYAIADAAGRARPLMISQERSFVQYIVAFAGDGRPWLIREKALLPTDLPDAPVAWSAQSTGDAPATQAAE